MEKNPLLVDASITLTIDPLDNKKVVIEDNLNISARMKTNLLIPYVNSLYDSFVTKSAKPLPGVPHYLFSEVLYHFLFLVSCLARANWRENV